MRELAKQQAQSPLYKVAVVVITVIYKEKKDEKSILCFGFAT